MYVVNRNVKVIGDVYWFLVSWLGWPDCIVPEIGIFWFCFVVNFGKLVFLVFWLTIAIIFLTTFWKNWIRVYIIDLGFLLIKKCLGKMFHRKRKVMKVMNVNHPATQAHLEQVKRERESQRE